MVAIVVLFGLLNNYYFSWAHFLDMGRQASLLVVTAIGATLVILAGEIDLSPGAIIGLTSVAVPQLLDLSIPMPVVLLLALLLGGFVGAVNGFITLRLAVPSFLTTLGTMAIARGIALYISDQPRQVSDEAFAAVFNGSFVGIPEVVLYSFGLAMLVALVCRYSRFGLQVRSVGSNQQGARFSGVATRRLKFLVFVAAGVFSAAGALLLLGRTLTGLSGGADGLELNAIAAVVLGGGRLGGQYPKLKTPYIDSDKRRGSAIRANRLNMMPECSPGEDYMNQRDHRLQMIQVEPAIQLAAKGTLVIIAVALDLYVRRRFALA
jgi:ribose transport system permease protein